MYEDLIDLWKRKRKQITPAKEEEVAAFEWARDIRLPDEFRQFLLETAGATTDFDTFCFYGIDQLKLWSEEKESIRNHAHPSTDAKDFIIFGDYLQWCYAYAIRVAGRTENLGEVILAGGLRDVPICKSFREFIDLYLVDDMRLHDTG